MITGKKVYKSQISKKIPINKPIIFWDTCGLLYLFNFIPEHTNNLKGTQDTYNHFVWIADRIKKGEIVSVTSELVLTEINDHIIDAKNALIKDQKNIQSEVERYAEFASTAAIKNRLKNDINSIEIESKLNKLFHKIISKTYILKEDKYYSSFAHFRVKNKFPPALKKSEYKDCYIWGTFITLIRSNNPPKGMFFTKNIEDFYDEKKKYPLQVLIDDMNGCNGFISKSIGEAHKLYP